LKFEVEMSQEIILTEDEDGILQIETAGYTGGACMKAVEALVEALGQTEQGSVVLKPEFKKQDPRSRSTGSTGRSQTSAQA
jgi:hypothetical protein